MKSYVSLLPFHLLFPAMSQLSLLLVLLSSKSPAIPSNSRFRLSLHLPWPIYGFQHFKFNTTSWFTPSTLLLLLQCQGLVWWFLLPFSIKHHDFSVASSVSFFTPLSLGWMVSVSFIWFPVGVRYKAVLCEWDAEREGLCLPATSYSMLQGVEVTSGRGNLFLPQK